MWSYHLLCVGIRNAEKQSVLSGGSYPVGETAGLQRALVPRGGCCLVTEEERTEGLCETRGSIRPHLKAVEDSERAV